MSDLKVFEVLVGDLKVYENNPRINEPAVDAVAESIKEFGFRVPIIIDKDYVIIAGHTRRLAAIKLGLEKVPCVIADDLSEEQVKAFRLVDNKTAELSKWNYTQLEEEQAKILKIDLSKFGFDLDEANIDMTDFFTDEEQKEKEPKMVQCPCCGEWTEI